jgi:2-polyprenyl-3-methyl-5-hydroxy-6-metoxy-1,4-benzoquinol methylase
MRYMAALLFAAGLCAGQALTPEATAFLKWYEGYQGSFYPQDVLKAYQQGLAGSGVADGEVKRRMAAVMDAMRAMPVEFTTLHFNKIYRAEKPPFRQEASQFVARVIEAMKPGTALDVAMGSGRNALYLASQGWDVTGYDVADQGLEMAQASAKKSGLSMKTVRATHAEFDYGVAKWDLVVEAFAFTDLADAGYRKRVVDSLKPGGVLVIDGFGGGPKNQMLEWFGGLRVIAYEDRDDIADWGMQKSRMARIAVRKE